MSRYRRTIISLIAVLFMASSSSGVILARDLSVSDLDTAVRSGICPSDLARVSRASYDEGCGRDFLKRVKQGDAIKCMGKVDALNRKIEEYNAFIGKCRRGKSEDQRAKERARQQELARQRQQQQERENYQSRERVRQDLQTLDDYLDSTAAARRQRNQRIKEECYRTCISKGPTHAMCAQACLW